MNTLEETGKTLKKLREGEGLNQSQFAKKVGLTQAAISQFEEGKRIPSTKSLQKIAVRLGLSVDALMGSASIKCNIDSEKDASIQILVTKLKDCKVSKDAITALNQFINMVFCHETHSQG